MKKSDAVRILGALAKGENPVTGDALLNDGVLSHPDVIRALFLGSQALGGARQAQTVTINRGARVVPAANGKAWTTEEDATLRREFVDEKQLVADIAQAHARTCGAIYSRLEKLGLLLPIGGAVTARSA